MSRGVARLGLGIAAIRHSGKLRARQTAEVLAREIKPPRGASEMPGLAPNDDAAFIVQSVEGETEPLMLVGHLPHLSLLASLLLVGDPTREVVTFQAAAVVALARQGGAGGSGGP